MGCSRRQPCFVAAPAGTHGGPGGPPASQRSSCREGEASLSSRDSSASYSSRGLTTSPEGRALGAVRAWQQRGAQGPALRPFVTPVTRTRPLLARGEGVWGPSTCGPGLNSASPPLLPVPVFRSKVGEACRSWSASATPGERWSGPASGTTSERGASPGGSGGQGREEGARLAFVWCRALGPKATGPRPLGAGTLRASLHTFLPALGSFHRRGVHASLAQSPCWRAAGEGRAWNPEVPGRVGCLQLSRKGFPLKSCQVWPPALSPSPSSGPRSFCRHHPGRRLPSPPPHGYERRSPPPGAVWALRGAGACPRTCTLGSWGQVLARTGF